jgi:hypothetical protein
MLNGGDWVVPHLNGLAYIEKPPLQYWAGALSYRLFGASEFSARLYSALTALATIYAGVAGRSPAVERGGCLARGGGVGRHADVRGLGSAADAGHEFDVLHDLEPRRVFARADGGAAARVDAAGVDWRRPWAYSPRAWSRRPSRRRC